MNGPVLTRTVVIANPQGLHMRPVSLFARRAGEFVSQVTVVKGEQRINGKSAFELMLLAAEQGTELVLEVSGPDAAEALDALTEILGAASFEDEPAAPSQVDVPGTPGLKETH